MPVRCRMGRNVFPETAVSGYLFSGPQQIAPFLDTIPGRKRLYGANVTMLTKEPLCQWYRAQ